MDTKYSPEIPLILEILAKHSRRRRRREKGETRSWPPRRGQRVTILPQCQPSPWEERTVKTCWTIRWVDRRLGQWWGHWKLQKPVIQLEVSEHWQCEGPIVFSLFILPNELLFGHTLTYLKTHQILHKIQEEGKFTYFGGLGIGYEKICDLLSPKRSPSDL